MITIRSIPNRDKSCPYCGQRVAGARGLASHQRRSIQCKYGRRKEELKEQGFLKRSYRYNNKFEEASEGILKSLGAYVSLSEDTYIKIPHEAFLALWRNNAGSMALPLRNAKKQLQPTTKAELELYSNAYLEMYCIKNALRTWATTENVEEALLRWALGDIQSYLTPIVKKAIEKETGLVPKDWLHDSIITDARTHGYLKEGGVPLWFVEAHDYWPRKNRFIQRSFHSTIRRFKDSPYVQYHLLREMLVKNKIRPHVKSKITKVIILSPTPSSALEEQ